MVFSLPGEPSPGGSFFFYLKKQSVQKPKHTTKAVFKKKTLPASVWTGLKSTSLKKKKETTEQIKIVLI